MAPFSLQNKFIAPTFENGVNGWTVSGTGAAGVTLSVSTDKSLHGTQCLKVSVPAGSGQVRLEPPSFPIIEDPYRIFALGFSVAAAGGQVHYGFERFKPDLTFHNVSTTASPTLTSTLTKFGKADYLSPDNAPFIGGLLPKIYVNKTGAAQEFYFDGFTWIDSADQELYPFILAPSTIPQISGSWADTDSYAYSWTGATEASVSVATHRAELFVPAAFNRGDTIEVTGTGFPASSTVDIIIGGHWNRDPTATGVATDGSGNLSTSVLVPYTHDPGMAYIVGTPAGGSIGSMMKQAVWTNPTDLSGTVTNYFPNPNGQTLAVDGITPKHFGPSNYEGDTITRVSVDGAYRARVTSEWGNVVIDLGPELLNTLGLEDGQQYLIRARLHGDPVSDDPWVYLQTSDGNSENALTGPSPWDLIGIGTGMFDGPGQLIASSWPEGGTVDIDQVTIVEAAVYLLGWINDLTPGSTLDGYEIGLRPGRAYQLAGYTYGTFKIRTGATEGSLTDLLVWNNVNPDEWPGGAVTNTFAIPDGHIVIQLEASGADDSNVSIHDYIPFFDGDTTDGGGYTYSWAGTPHDSASLRTAAEGGPAIDAQVFVGGVAKTVSEIRAVTGGVLTPVTEMGP